MNNGRVRSFTNSVRCRASRSRTSLSDRSGEGISPNPRRNDTPSNGEAQQMCSGVRAKRREVPAVRGRDEDGSDWITSGDSSLRARSVESQLPAGRHALPENPVHLTLGGEERRRRVFHTKTPDPLFFVTDANRHFFSIQLEALGLMVIRLRLRNQHGVYHGKLAILEGEIDGLAGCGKNYVGRYGTTGEPSAGCSKGPSSKTAASEGPRRYRPHFVWAVRPSNESWRTENPLQGFRSPGNSSSTLRV